MIYRIRRETSLAQKASPEICSGNAIIPIIKILKKGKEYHGFRYTNMIGKARMTMKAALTFMCINLKKLAKILAENPSLSGCFMRLLQFLMSMLGAQNKMASAITC